MQTATMKQIMEELRIARSWKMAGKPKAADKFLRSAFTGLKRLAYHQPAGRGRDRKDG